MTDFQIHILTVLNRNDRGTQTGSKPEEKDFAWKNNGFWNYDIWVTI